MGDYVDTNSPSNRDRLRAANLYDPGMIDDIVKRYCDELLEVLLPTRNRWIGMLEGHHWHQFEDGGTSDTYLCQRLNATFLGTCAITRLTFADNAKHTAVYKIWSHHGAISSGSTLASPLNKLVAFSARCDADMFLIAHSHQLPAGPFDAISVNDKGPVRINHRTKWALVTGSFMRGYLQGHTVGGRPGGTYVEKNMLPPASLGAQLITLTPTRDSSRSYVHVNLEMGGPV